LPTASSVKKVVGLVLAVLERDAHAYAELSKDVVDRFPDFERVLSVDLVRYEGRPPAINSCSWSEVRHLQTKPLDDCF